ncbi:MAG: hypothetical protein A2V90_03290 [Gammaproteobacteria bacterium RBG_16_57_12]|nr:MAG: hypothetical protein A2V90_03290 [Gammaproteobacteria bacterium RBG_16_57_12]
MVADKICFDHSGKVILYPEGIVPCFFCLRYWQVTSFVPADYFRKVHWRYYVRKNVRCCLINIFVFHPDIMASPSLLSEKCPSIGR